MAVWMLIPEQMGDDETAVKPRFGVFGTAVGAFFLAEMGDKTQVATMMLAAQYQAYFPVITGTTLGMMPANAPVVWLGNRMTRLLPMRAVHRVSGRYSSDSATCWPRCRFTGISSSSPSTNITEVLAMAIRWLPCVSQVSAP